MNAELAEAKQAPLMQWTDEQVNTIRETVAKGATDNELKMFLHLSQTYGLDPFAKEIWFMKMDSKPVIMTSRDGYLKIANNSPDFEGIVSDAVYEGDMFRRSPDRVDHQYGVKQRGRIIGAYALVYRKGIRFPVYVFAPFANYDKNNNVWRTYPHAMILKVAESMALKRAFSLSGLVSREELDIEDKDGNAPEHTEAAAKALGTAAVARQIFEKYKELLGNDFHARNAILKVTGGRGSKDLTSEDIDALYSDLARREAEGAERGESADTEPAIDAEAKAVA
jgi:phage recombination protein Bet